MNHARSRSLLILAAFSALAAAAPLRAQERSAPPPQPGIQLKVQVVLNEFDGNKKEATLPYTFFVNADDPNPRKTTQIRTGLRVPIATRGAGSEATAQFTYMDVGTNLDCTALSVPEGRFKLEISIDRTYLYNAPNGLNTGISVSSVNPIIGHFTSSYNLVVRDGQAVEATTTTDPISGHVLVVSVTTTVVKEAK